MLIVDLRVVSVFGAQRLQRALVGAGLPATCVNELIKFGG
jgi:hypothetical protein